MYVPGVVFAEVNMGRFPIDVVEFVEARFVPREYAGVFKVLAVDAFSSPRVMRGALFLADGDIALLKHYAKTCATDPGNMLVRAEFVLGATEDPLCAEDFSELYLPGHAPARRGHLALDHDLPVGVPLLTEPQLTKTLPKRANRRVPQSDHHSHLRDREFVLGNVVYVVAAHQPHAQYVQCSRKEGENSRMVRLPYVFVMDRLAERIELTSTDVREF
jgi:hypothetical protein